MELKLGEIFRTKWDNQIVRIIGFDQYEVLYDAYWEEDKSWTFSSNLDNDCFFYRTRLDVFINGSEKIDYRPFTNEEYGVFKPDLTLRIGRTNLLSWNNSCFNEDESLQECLNDLTDFSSDEIIDVEKLWLYPIKKDNCFGKGEILKARNEKHFTLIELLINANNIIKKVNKKKSNGIGLYRLGIKNRQLSYYIGEYLDLAGVMQK